MTDDNITNEQKRVETFVKESNNNELLKKYDITLINRSRYIYFKVLLTIAVIFIIATTVTSFVFMYKGYIKFGGDLNATINNAYEFKPQTSNDYTFNPNNPVYIVANINCQGISNITSSNST